MDKDKPKPKRKKLTPKQEKFAQNVAKGLSQVDSYRDAYKPKSDNKNVHRVDAYAVAKSPNVSLMIEELKARAERNVVWTRQMAVEALLEAADIARGQKHSQGMTGALKELNAMYGYNEATKINIGGQKDNPIVVAQEEKDL